MRALLILPLCLLQDPQPAPTPELAPAAPAPAPQALFSDWIARLERAPVLHLIADGVMLTTSQEAPDRSERWEFHSEVWMAKRGRVNARTRWTGPRPLEGEPESFTTLLFADGVHCWQGLESEAPLKQEKLSSARCVPYPLPEVFGLFDRPPDTALPETRVGETFDWGEPQRKLPTVVVLDPEQPESSPAFWYGFAGRELAGWCTMMPEELGGDVLRAKLVRLEWLERLPEKDPPRFAPAAR
jgi:hypothetical protein